MAEEKIDKRIEQANGRLKAAKIGLRIVRRRGGKRLSLRGTFPPKPGTGQTKSSGQWLSLKVNATWEGVAQAEQEAKRIGGLLALGRFDWSEFIEEKAEVEVIGDLLEKLKKQKLEVDAIAPGTWKQEYEAVFNGVLDQPIAESLLEEIVLGTNPNTRTRRRKAIACACLADLAGLNGDKFRRMTGKYSIKLLTPRDLPEDEQIVRWWHQIYQESKEWAYVFGLMAVYGLRNHETFFSDLGEYPLLWVSRGKTGERYVYPFYPEWADEFKLKDGILPNVNRKDNQGYGQAVTKGLQKFLPGLLPYNLRHCWAVRTIGAIDQTLAAAQMGHAVSVHNEIYQHWIKRDTHQKAFDLYLQNPSRPKAPRLS